MDEHTEEQQDQTALDNTPAKKRWFSGGGNHPAALVLVCVLVLIIIYAAATNGNKNSPSVSRADTSVTESEDDKAEKNILKDVIEQAESKDADELEPTSYEDLQQALNEAKAVYQNEDATQADVDTAISKLENTIDQLKYKPANKDELHKTIEKASSLKRENYNAETWEKMQDKFETAKIVADRQEARQEEVDLAAADLDLAISLLESAPKPEDYESVSYKSIARTPDDYVGMKIKFSGKVIQVLEGDGDTINLRVATDDSYGDVVLVIFNQSIMGGTHVLEDDQITFYGIYRGTYTYESTMGGHITVPAVNADRIDINS